MCKPNGNNRRTRMLREVMGAEGSTKFWNESRSMYSGISVLFRSLLMENMLRGDARILNSNYNFRFNVSLLLFLNLYRSAYT